MPQYVPLGTVAAPADWVLPPSLRLSLAALYAQFDGTNAAGSFVPTVEILSDSGHTVVEVQQDSTVAAGSSVVASWAPFLKTATAGAASSTSTEQSSSPVVMPVLSPMPFYTDNSGFQWAQPSSSSPTGGVFTNRYDINGTAKVPANGDYYTWPVNLGPEGSIWALHVHTLGGPDCGMFQPAMASAVAPDPGRAPGDELGTIEDYNAGTYMTTAGSFNTYRAVPFQLFGFKAMAFRLMGAPGDQWTANIGVDPGTSAILINGGPGPYTLRLKVVGQDFSSSGFALDICAVTFWRLDDVGVL